MEGTVKWFNRAKGYGFIIGSDGKEYFVHHSALAQGTFLRDNDRVSFDPAENERGMQATNVTLLQKGSEIAGNKPARAAPAEESEESEGTEEVEESEDFEAEGESE